MDDIAKCEQSLPRAEGPSVEALWSITYKGCGIHVAVHAKHAPCQWCNPGYAFNRNALEQITALCICQVM